MGTPSLLDLFTTLEEAVTEIHRVSSDVRNSALDGLLADCQTFTERFQDLATQDGNGALAGALAELYVLFFKIHGGEAAVSDLDPLLKRIADAIKPVEAVKLVVWDLDETLWRGTLAEGDAIEISQARIDIVKTLTTRGIVNSICSKNNFDRVREQLESVGLWTYFIFPHIDFTPKGEAVKAILADMRLRAVNALFIDDNRLNIAEVLHCNPGIQTLGADKIDELLAMPALAGKPDPQMKRLAQYKMLERRAESRRIAATNEEFLRNSDIRVYLEPTRIDDAERVHDMIMRTNQLNFRKRRISLGKVKALIADPGVKSETVTVTDRFGDHGIVGWYALRNGELLHFLFSCRIINLGVEQSVYAYLAHPKLKIVGEVASSVSAKDGVFDWISIERKAGEPVQSTGRGGGAGGCDPRERG